VKERQLYGNEAEQSIIGAPPIQNEACNAIADIVVERDSAGCVAEDPRHRSAIRELRLMPSPTSERKFPICDVMGIQAVEPNPNYSPCRDRHRVLATFFSKPHLQESA
jgi:hypothetical protein